MFNFYQRVGAITGSTLILSCLVLAACSGGEVEPVGVIDETAEMPEDWGPPEHTHINFTSQTANKKCPPEERGVFYIDPIPKLVELARDHNVVMINEAHYKPIHRAFIGEFAEALTDLDFDHFGAETFGPKEFLENYRNQSLNARGYPVVTDGTYTKEPVFGQLVETVLEAGYTLFAYEQIEPIPEGAQSSVAHRDTGQAKNILHELGDDPDKKILIHAGYHHIREVPSGLTETKWMAQYFTEMSGIDPLTINQTDCYSQSAYDAGLFGYAMPVDIDGNPISSDGYDVIIIPPKEAQFNGRPVWLREIGRRFVDVPTELKIDDQYTRITARNVDRVESAVVEDTIYRPPHSDKPMSLRPGTYRLEVTDKTKKVLTETEITVP